MNLSTAAALHERIRHATSGVTRQMLDEHTPYDTRRAPDEEPDTPDIGCVRCVNWAATQDPSAIVPAAWPCLPVRAVAELAGLGEIGGE